MPIIKTENLTFQYEKNAAPLILDDINLEINQGDFVAILGHNGSGKSTIAKHFNAILLPCGGSVYIDGINTSDENRLFDIRQRVGMVFQNPDNQIVATIVEEDVAFAPENLGVPPLEIRKRVDDALEQVSMSNYKRHAPHQLSGGQKQRVAIAGILAMQPTCIVLDEPTAMLDPKGRREVISTIKKLNTQNNTTVVLITHFMDEVGVADRVIVMEYGKIIMDNTPIEVFKQVDHLKSVGLDVPPATELCHLLKEQGLNISDDILTIEDCVHGIAKLLSSNN